MRIIQFFVVLLGAALVVAWSCVFFVDERQQVVVLAFGRVDRIVREPGLHFKYPAPFNTTEAFEDRILSFEARDLEVTPLDNRRLVVSAFARYRIADVQTFRRSFSSADDSRGQLTDILTARVRQVLGSVNSDNILSDERADLMRRIRQSARAEAVEIGVEMIDVRILRADLPDANLAQTYSRMRAERAQVAADERARGREAALIRRAEANREAIEIVSDARRQSETIRGEADAEKTRITAEAYGRDPEFFQFYRSLRALETALNEDNSTLILTPDGGFGGEFFRSLSEQAPAAQAQQ